LVAFGIWPGFVGWQKYSFLPQIYLDIYFWQLLQIFFAFRFYITVAFIWVWKVMGALIAQQLLVSRSFSNATRGLSTMRQRIPVEMIALSETHFLTHLRKTNSKWPDSKWSEKSQKWRAWELTERNKSQTWTSERIPQLSVT